MKSISTMNDYRNLRALAHASNVEVSISNAYHIGLFNPTETLEILSNHNIADLDLQDIIYVQLTFCVWIMLFVYSLYNIGKEFQKKPLPDGKNTKLVKKEAYYRSLDIQKALDKLQEDNPEIEELKRMGQRLVEKLSVESDFGYGKKEVIECETDIYVKLSYIKETIPRISREMNKEDYDGVKEAFSDIISMLRKRSEMKKK